MKNNNMLGSRILSGAVIIALGLVLIYTGGWIYTTGLGVILSIAIWEYVHLFEKGGYAPAKAILIAGTFLIALSGQFADPAYSLAAFSLVVIAIMVFHTATFNHHPATAAIDLAASLGGVAYIAFSGLFLVRLRFLPAGLFWLLQCILPAGISDIGAFGIGSLWGKHKIAPQLSPNKTFEGYLGGVATSMLVGWGTGALLAGYNPAFNGLRGFWIGLIVGALCPLGDFTKSIFKRQFGVKNTGNLIPGHGGVLDRIDTWLIAGVISYLMILFLNK